jgi:gas vesicle protein
MSLKENAWTREVRFIKEDNLLYEFVIERKIRKWTKIANALSENLGGQPRSGKQCRERWHNHLDPDIKKDVWSKEEKSQIFELQKKFGNRWSKISKYIPGRTDNSVKNCFYSVIRKNVRKYNKRKPETEKLKGPIKSFLRNPEIKDLLFNPKLKLSS